MKKARTPRALTVELKDFELSMQGPEGREMIAIDPPESPRTRELARYLFAQLGTMHLVAPYLPRSIRTNFQITSPVRRLVNAMYEHELRLLEGDDCPVYFPDFVPRGGKFLDGLAFQDIPRLNNSRAAVLYSSGKDSLWNMGWSEEKFGRKNVLLLHVAGLNKSNYSEEYRFAQRQIKEIGFPNARVVHMRSSSRNNGYGTMRSRDMFMMGLAIPHALEFGASQLVTEGFAEAKPREPFTGIAENMRFFNATLKAMDLPMRVIWRNKKEMGIIKDMYLRWPDWMPHLCNCFLNPCYRGGQRKMWAKVAPHFPFYDSQCGSCVKCRITMIGRILYDPAMRKVPLPEIKAYLESTNRWLADTYVKHADMVEGSFLDAFQKIMRQYEVPYRDPVAA